MSRPRRRWSRNSIEMSALRVLKPLGIAFFVIVSVFPFYYMILLSIRDISQVIQSPGSLFPSLDELSLDAYERVLKPTSEGGQGFVRFLINSALLGAGTVAVTLVASILGAYAVARLQFFGRRTVHPCRCASTCCATTSRRCRGRSRRPPRSTAARVSASSASCSKRRKRLSKMGRLHGGWRCNRRDIASIASRARSSFVCSSSCT